MYTMTLCVVLAASVASVTCLSDKVIYDLSQALCTEIERPATGNCIWSAGLDSFADQIAEGGRIVTYKIRWFSGKWSDWYVPGVNDLDGKFNLRGKICKGLPYKANTMRRMWSYFYDHTHKFIICKARRNAQT